MAKFSKGSAAATPATKKRKSRWAGVKSKSDQIPILTAGRYVLKYKGAKIKNESGEWCTLGFEVMAASGDDSMDPGSEGVMLQGLDDRYNIGLGKVKSFVMALIGCPDDDAYDEFDPEGEFLDAFIYGEDNGRLEEAKEYIGTEIECVVRRGKDIVKDGVPTGDCYREFTWTINEDEDE